MSGHVKTADGWRAMTKIPARIDTGLEEVVSGWYKMDTGWVRIWSSGAMIEYLDYPYPIPVMKGWEYSTDGKNWITVAVDGEPIITPFTGYVKVKGELSLTEYANIYGSNRSAKIPITEGSTYDINDWDMSGLIYTWNEEGYILTLSGITGSFPECKKVVVHTPYGDFSFLVSDNDPNIKSTQTAGPFGEATSVSLLDADGNVIANSSNPDMDTSITADVSKVLTFDTPVTGTINYVAGDLLPSVQITVTDDSGNVIEGAEITIEIPSLTLTFTGNQHDTIQGDGEITITIAGLDQYPNATQIGWNWMYSGGTELLYMTSNGTSTAQPWMPAYYLIDKLSQVDVLASDGSVIAFNVPYEVIDNVEY